MNDKNIHSLNATGRVEEAAGWLMEQIDAGAQMLTIVLVDEEGKLYGQAFGPLTVADLTLFGAYLQKRALEHVDREY